MVGCPPPRTLYTTTPPPLYTHANVNAYPYDPDDLSGPQPYPNPRRQNTVSTVPIATQALPPSFTDKVGVVGGGGRDGVGGGGGRRGCVGVGCPPVFSPVGVGGAVEGVEGLLGGATEEKGQEREKEGGEEEFSSKDGEEILQKLEKKDKLISKRAHPSPLKPASNHWKRTVYAN